MNHKKDELLQNLAGALVAILFGCVVLICIIANLPNTKELDGALIANVFSAGATLFAPISAYYLLCDWKEQHNKNIELVLLDDLTKNFRELNFTFRKISLDIQSFYLSYLPYELFNDITKEKVDQFKIFNEKVENLFIELSSLSKQADLDLESSFICYKETFDFTIIIFETINNIQKLDISNDEKILKISNYLNKEQGSSLYLPNGNKFACIGKNGRTPNLAYKNFQTLYQLLSRKKLAK